jgi:hypothetical protein
MTSIHNQGTHADSYILLALMNTYVNPSIYNVTFAIPSITHGLVHFASIENETKCLVESDRILRGHQLFMTDGPNGSCKDQ